MSVAWVNPNGPIRQRCLSEIRGGGQPDGEAAGVLDVQLDEDGAGDGGGNDEQKFHELHRVSPSKIRLGGLSRLRRLLFKTIVFEESLSWLPVEMSTVEKI